MKARLIAFLSLATTLVGIASAQRIPPAVPFTIASDTGLMMIAGATGPQNVSSFVFDTGAGLTVLAQSLVDKLGGKPAGQYTGFRLSGERLDVQLYIIPELSIGPVTQRQVLVGGWDGLDKLHLSGIIALSFFRNQPFTLDFQHQQLFFETGISLAHRRSTGNLVSIQLDDQRGISLDIFAPFLVSSHPAQCEVDTGSQGNIFSSRYMKLLGLDANSSGVRKSEHTSILGNKEYRYNATLPTLQLEGNPSTAQQQTPTLFEDIIYDCNVGIGFWAGHLVTFDIPDKVLIVSVR
jgi:hypothetical protein